MSIQTRLVEHDHDRDTFEGLLAWDDAIGSPRPGVLVAHTIMGRSALEEGRARQLAELGYVGYAIDVYGKGTQSQDREANRERMDALKADRPGLQARLLAALGTLREQPEVDASQVAAIGYCFGGLCVLDIARTGEGLAGVVSFHGLFEAPGNTEGNAITARVLACHGWDDPMATPDKVVALADELTAMGADWQLHAYGNTMHAFTNPQANDPGLGTIYNESADQRSWTAMTNFLAEIFGSGGST